MSKTEVFAQGNLASKHNFLSTTFALATTGLEPGTLRIETLILTAWPPERRLAFFRMNTQVLLGKHMQIPFSREKFEC